jgi:hypothetical protein
MWVIGFSLIQTINCKKIALGWVYRQNILLLHDIDLTQVVFLFRAGSVTFSMEVVLSSDILYQRVRFLIRPSLSSGCTKNGTTRSIIYTPVFLPGVMESKIFLLQE